MDEMDSGGVLRLHYSFCYRLSVHTRLCHAAHAHSLCSTGQQRRDTKATTSLGVVRQNFTFAPRGCHGKRRPALPAASRF